MKCPQGLRELDAKDTIAEEARSCPQGTHSPMREMLEAHYHSRSVFITLIPSQSGSILGMKKIVRLFHFLLSYVISAISAPRSVPSRFTFLTKT